ncbi:MAG: FAD-dependent oxidoreductase [Methylococcaceae bacterium]|nr:FAD-dependent oxidoreductase [Methylococcaceae bacterium]MDZ4155039.1 FAD-dependent oxidoreductase [Methylococcales bacterium]MDP2394516.1 FAD-dependent oxidoreductase [Methylococcaceae bacterium]MDP3021559.1 FAD-dependent oxidoreductase [Methylococcaceae bacterium]MDP3388685.1 FAD-dependent oxidoreductase [Methylococcaceae bacterium]
MKKRLVVIGNGMAGMRTVEELLSAAPKQYEITVFGAEPYGNYNRIMLSAVLAGDKSIEDIVINDRQWYVDHGITLHAGADKAVVGIDRSARTVIAKDGSIAAYDRLLIATGSQAVIAEVQGCDLDGVISFRDIIDVNKMLAYSDSHKHAVVLGGGLLGLEAANGLALRGMNVTVIHNNELLLNRQLDKPAAKMLQAELEQRGIKFKMAAKLQSLRGDNNNHITAVQFADGSELACDLFIMAIGVRPNMALAKQSGLYCERGIVVNDTLQSYDPSIYAVGECIQHRGATFGLVAPLFEQAKVCANHLSAHGVAEYITLPTATKLKVTGIKLFSVGDFIGEQGSESIQFSDPGLGIYKKLVIKANQLVGAVLYGDTADGAWYQELLEKKADISGIRDILVFGKAYA